MPEVELDQIDVMILKTLLKNARTSMKAVAERCQVSTVSIHKRIKRLKKTGVITGTSVSIRLEKLGYTSVAGFGLHTKAPEEKNLFEFLKKFPQVLSIVQSFGTKDLIVLAGSRTNREMENLLQSIKNRPGIEGISFDGFVSEFTFIPENIEILPGKKGLSYSNPELVTEKKVKSPADSGFEILASGDSSRTVIDNLDEIELHIANELMIDGLIPFSEIARKIGVSPETIRTRYYSMRKAGVITQCSITIDLSKIGFEGQAYLLIKVFPSKEKLETFNLLKETKNVTVVGRLIGTFDLSVIAVIKNLKSLTNLLEQIKLLPGVDRIETNVVTNPVFRRIPSENKFTQNESI